MNTLFRLVSGAGDVVELWLVDIAQDRLEQRRQVRAWMKEVLARREPDLDLRWVETSRGPVPEGSAWRVSVSYSGTHVLCGFSRQGTPGVDLTQIAAFPELGEVASLYFGLEQSASIKNLPPSEQERQFARAWSLLEARQKACGIGLQEYSATRDARLEPAEVCFQVVLDTLCISAVLVPGQA